MGRSSTTRRSSKHRPAKFSIATGNTKSAITVWFLALMVGAALLAPVGILLGRITRGISAKPIAALGITAATVQVIGLSRWVLLIPGVSADATDPSLSDDAHRTFEDLHFGWAPSSGKPSGTP